MTIYRWHTKDGVLGQDNQQRLQLIGGTKKFRNMCGKLLVEKLNTIERGMAFTKECRAAERASREAALYELVKIAQENYMGYSK